MLVLTRKLNEVIKIGDNISIMVIEIRGDKVRLGISAPHNVAVHRKEIYDAINGVSNASEANAKSIEIARDGSTTSDTRSDT